MAKRRKEKDEEEEIDFKIPKFDEEKFLKKERRNIKTLFISFLFGLVMAAITFGFWTLLQGHFLRWDLVFLLAVVNAVWIKYLFIRLDVDFTDFGKKQWFTTYAIYFFTWLLVFIVIVNPPFYDEDAPRIEAVVLPNMQELGGTVNIIAQIIDNVNVDKANINFTLTYPNDTKHYPEFTFEDNFFNYTYENSDNLLGEYIFTIKATDSNGHTTEKNETFKYDDGVIVLITPTNGSDLYSYTPIEFRVNEDVFTPVPFIVEGEQSFMDFRVYYKVNDSEEINVSRLDKTNRKEYRTTAEYVGWQKNTNTTLKAYVEVSYYFMTLPLKFSNTVEDTTTYRFETLNDDEVKKIC